MRVSRLVGLWLWVAGLGMGLAAQPGGWQLKWSDEFNIGTEPDAKVWGYEEGMVRNEEAQVYTKGRKENVRIEGGCLVIEARREKIENPNFKEGSEKWNQKWKYGQFSSGSLTTKGKKVWKYGRVEVRAKMPKGRGVWPAVWMLGEDLPTVGWPACGELDIVEFLGRDPKGVHGTVHYQKDGKRASSGKRMEVDGDLSEDFHLYAMEWSEDQIDFYFDQKKYHCFKFQHSSGHEATFRKPYYLLLNLAMGGNWGKAVDPELDSAKYLIDYVRIYERK